MISTVIHRGYKSIFVIVMLVATMIFCQAHPVYAQEAPAVVVLWDDNFPVTDTAEVSRTRLATLLPSAKFVSSAETSRVLASSSTKLVVVPFGSTFPEESWTHIYNFLKRGGNLLTLGGRPFTRPAYSENGVWKLRPETYAFARQLFINDYQPTPPSSSLTPVVNDVVPTDLPSFAWDRAYSVVVRLSDETTAPRDGASGTLDASLKTILWGVNDHHRQAAPIIEIDHLRNNFVGGRWIMMNCELPKSFYASTGAARLLSSLASRALQGAEEFSISPTFPLFLPDESWQFHVVWNRLQQSASSARLEVVVESGGKREAAQTLDISPQQYPFTADIKFDSSSRPGLHTVVARLHCGKSVCGVYRTGFWVRDVSAMRTGPVVTVDRDFFQIDGRPLPVVGTTYMASDVQRQYFKYPNPYVWDQDLGEISSAGLNMIRTGWWSDWDQITGGTGVATEHTLRTIEAFLMTARKHNLPVQFTFFAFTPEVLGGGNPYLDPEALRRQQAFVRSVVEPFKDVLFLMWDVINEPSFDNPKRLWSTRPNGDAHELRSWNQWLTTKYADRGAIQSAWKTVLPKGPLPVPAERDFSVRSANEAGRPLASYDFHVFAQEQLRDWVQALRKTILQTGSKQLVTVGQDESGGQMGPSPAFFHPAVDFTTMHSWWANDDLLWDSLVAKQQGLPMLVQETGLQHEFDVDARPRRDSANEAKLLERKIAMALGTSAGAIEWLWNVNSYMRLEAEVTIGAVRPDGTEKAEADVMRAFAQFANVARDHFRQPQATDVAIVTSQALQYSAIGKMALDAQTRAVRVMNYDCRIPARLTAENHIQDIGDTKLVILPSAQALNESTWKALLQYVENGGNLLITGPIERDEHWLRTHRLAELGVRAEPGPLTYRGARIDFGESSLNISFGQGIQERAETLRIADGKSYLELKRGKGSIFLVSEPVELGESPDVAARLYLFVLSRVGIEPSYDGQPVSTAVLVRPVAFADSVLYLFVSESSRDEDVDLQDRLTGAELRFRLPSQRAKLVLVGKSNGQVLAVYNGPDL